MNKMKPPAVKNVQDFRPTDAHGDTRMGQLMLKEKMLAPPDIERVLALQQKKNLRFGEAARELGLVSEEDVQRILARQFRYPRLAPGEGGFSPELVAAYSPFSPHVEALRALRSQLMLRWFGTNQKTLAVVGAALGDGTSYTAANLAIVFSQLGERTLLVDADLRNPRQHEIFKLTNREGLSDILAGRAGLELLEKPEQFQDLSLLGAGTRAPNPQELLSRRTFALFLQGLVNRFDVILFDTSPDPDIADSQAVAAHCGGALMVVRPNHTRMAQAAALKDRLVACGAQFTGAVINHH